MKTDIKISVIIPTYNFFMKAQQIEALTAQTFKDFELIVVDGHYDENKGIETPFPLIHIPPANPVPYFSLAAPFNDAISRASGKYVFFSNDYVVPEKHCLARHYELQERFGGCLLSGRDLAVEGTPAMQDGKKVLVQDYRMAIFDTGTLPSIKIDDDVREIERIGIQNWWAGHNDSCPLEALLACNGFDESFDGCWGGQDAEMANRLMTFGLHYYLDRKSICFAFPHQRGAKKNFRSEADQQSLQYGIIDKKVAGKIYTANQQWFVMIPRDVKEEWNENHNI